jgi:hypothetical protein
VELILGAALDVLPKLAEEGRKFDLVFIDAAWEELWDYFQWAVKLARVNGCIYVDNVVRELLESENVGEGGTLITKVGREEKVMATVVSVVRAKMKRWVRCLMGFCWQLLRRLSSSLQDLIRGSRIIPSHENMFYSTRV